MSNKSIDCLTVDVGLEEGDEVGVDVVGADVGMELGVGDGCANVIVFRGCHLSHVQQFKKEKNAVARS
jgi:hypothetical protein